MIDPNRPRIPKPFRTPRPMASGPARRRPAWLDLDAAAVAAGMLAATLAPLTGADEAARAWALAAAAERAPSERAALVTVPAEAMRGGDCGRALADALRRGGARGALLLEPVDTLCALDGRPAPPVAPLAIGDLRIQGGAVVGFDHGATAALGAFGLEPAAWVVPKAQLSVPVFSLRDLDNGAVPASALGDRVALVAAGAASALPPGDGTASALGGLLDGGARREAPGWAAPLFVLAAGVLLRIAARRGALAAVGVLAALIAVLAFGQVLLASQLASGLLPSASALLGVTMAFAGVLGAGARRRSAAAVSAHGLLDRAALHRLQGVHALPDADFWLRVARLAGQSHPSDAVIVADLPPAGWHLRFWNDRQGGERLVAEKRRDVRRAPFSDEPGVYRIQVLQRFLTREEVPVVAVPLLASGELEGYVFLCGASAESTFTREPERAERLSRELALLARRRRLSRRAEAEGAAGAAGAASVEENLVESAQVALGDLRLLGAALRGAPTAILIADAFGDVRLLSRELGAWLKGREAGAPGDGPSGALAPGELSLGDVLAAARGGAAERGRGAAQLLSRVMERDEGMDLPVEGPEPAVLHVRAIRQESEGLSWIAGYVAALTRVDVASPATKVRSIGGRDSVDPLSAFSLGELTAEAVAASARATGRTLKLEPIRSPILTLGHRAELGQALEAFLTDMSSRALPGHQPAVSVRETPQGPQLSVLDVGFGLGLPESALERVLIAPSAAPAGLETLGRLIVAVEDSHGQAELRTNDGWGITLVLTLLRAQPRLSAAADAGKAAAAAPASGPNVIALGRK